MFCRRRPLRRPLACRDSCLPLPYPGFSSTYLPCVTTARREKPRQARVPRGYHTDDAIPARQAGMSVVRTRRPVGRPGGRWSSACTPGTRCVPGWSLTTVAALGGNRVFPVPGRDGAAGGNRDCPPPFWLTSLLLSRRAGAPLGSEDGHDGGVDPRAVVAEGLAEQALGAEAGLLVGAAGARVERVDLKRYAVQAQVLEAVADDQPGGLRAEAAVAPPRPDEDAEVAALVARVPLVEHRLADARARRLVGDRKVEAVGLVVAGEVPVTEGLFL